MGESLPELIQHVAWIERMLVEEPDDEAWMEALKQVQLDVAEKVDGYHFVVERLNAAAKLWGERANEDRRIKKSCELVVERLEEAIRQGILHGSGTEALGNRFRFKLANCKPSLKIEESQVPPEYFIQVTTLVVDKERIRAALERGETVPGASLEGGYALRKYANNPTRKLEKGDA